MLLEDRKFLLCFGCQRGGTTWLNYQLRKHPGFDFPPHKELRYLDPIYVHDFEKTQKKRMDLFQHITAQRVASETSKPTEEETKKLNWYAKYCRVSRRNYNDDWYRSLFDDVDESKVTGDFSPDYSLLPDEGVEHLYSLIPKAKLLFILRNPVDRILSGASYAIRHETTLSSELRQRRLEHATNSPLQFGFSNYKEIISRYEKIFPQSSIKVLFHEEIRDNPLHLISSACKWGGVEFDKKYFSKSADQVVNHSVKQQFPEEMLRKINLKCLPTLEWLADRYGGKTEIWLEKAKSTI